MPDDCQLGVLCCEWPGGAEGVDRSALAIDCAREFDVLARMLAQGSSVMHVIVAVSLMPGEEPGSIEMAAGVKRSFLHFAHNHGIGGRSATPSLAVVISGALPSMAGKRRRRNPSQELARLEAAAGTVLFAVQSIRRSSKCLVIDGLPELG